MKKYVTFVKDEEESRKVQEALRSAGFDVLNNYYDKPFLHFSSTGGMTWCDDFQYSVNKGGWRAINSHTIVIDPFQLDGAKQPEKMIEVDGKEYSASTIKAALQEYVK